MKSEELLRAILPDVLIDNFEVVKYEKTDVRFDIWLDEKKVQLREDKYNSSVISHGFGDYRVIQDFPLRGRATYLHVRNGWTRTRVRYSPMNGTCPSMTRLALTPSSSLF